VHILLGLGLALALLYFWLVGWWFARVVVFLGLAVCGFVLGGWFAIGFAGSPPGTALLSSPAGVLGGLLGVALAWPIASLPIWYLNWRIRRMIATHVHRVDADAAQR
jgi:hypothetical protein